MFKYSVTEEKEIKWINLSGRIDSVSSKDLEVPLKELAASGERRIAVSFEEVTYVSSAGLRVFLILQKELKKVGGEIFLYKMSESVFTIFKIGGFDRLFKIIKEKKEISPLEDKEKKSPPGTSQREIKGILLKIKEQSVPSGSIVPIGSLKNLNKSTYTEDNVISIKPEDITFGAGLVSLGENYGEYKKFFGEGLIINNNLFVYPATKRATVDFMIYSGRETEIKYHFLHGFHFNGSPKYVLSFESIDSFIELPDLIEAFFEVSRANIIGIVFLAESKGLFGMHLKKIPISENKLPPGQNIFQPHNFPEWMNFSIESEDINQVVLAAGIAVRDKSKEKEELVKLLPQKNNFHLHGCVFQQKLFNREVSKFHKEIKRIITELKPLSIKHLLNKSQFKYGIAEIIELKG